MGRAKRITPKLAAPRELAGNWEYVTLLGLKGMWKK